MSLSGDCGCVGCDDSSALACVMDREYKRWSSLSVLMLSVCGDGVSVGAVNLAA